MTESYRFYKTPDNQWFIDIPEYPGSVQDLQMVLGADEMLDILSNKTDEVWLKVSDTKQLENAIDYMYPDISGGVWYELFKYEGKELRHKLWLCPVVVYIFQEYPFTIYFEKL